MRESASYFYVGQLVDANKFKALAVPVPDMTYNVFGGTLNLAQLVNIVAFV